MNDTRIPDIPMEAWVELYITRADGTVEQLPNVPIDDCFDAIERFKEATNDKDQ